MRYLYALLFVFLTPMPLSAQDAADEWGSLEFGLRAGVGFFGLIACLVFLHGFITYLTRLGTERREEGIKTMAKGTSVLIFVVITLGLLRWLEG